MQLVVGHFYIQYKVLYGEEDTVAHACSYDISVNTHIDMICDGAVAEMKKVRNADLRECDEDKLSFIDLLPLSLNVLRATKKMLHSLHDVIPLTSCISAPYRQELRRAWEIGSGAHRLDEVVEVQEGSERIGMENIPVPTWEKCVTKNMNEDGVLFSDVSPHSELKTPLFLQMLQLMEHCKKEGRGYLQPHKMMREHAVSDLLASGCCDDLLQSLTKAESITAPREMKDLIKWYAYIPVNRKIPPQIRNVQSQSRVLAIWDSLLYASQPYLDDIVSVQRTRTDPNPPKSRLAQPERLDVSARAFDVQYGWQMLYEHVVEIPYALSLVVARGGAVFQNGSDVYLKRRVKEHER